MTLIPGGISLRLFFIILTTMVLLSWQFLQRGSEYLETTMRQSVEMTLVDMARLIAAGLANDANNGKLNTNNLAAQVQLVQRTSFDAQIYDHHKQALELSIYVTNANGIVVYDSQHQAVGQDYSRWNDVYLALQGQYGARSSYITPNPQHKDAPKMMVVGVPITVDEHIIGMVAVTQPYSVHDTLRLRNGMNLRWFVLGYLALALIVLILMARWLASALHRITNYAEAMAANKPTRTPRFSDVYLHRLAEAIHHLRQELNGKQTVEHYVHHLTHELKTPLTSIHAAAEILAEPELTTQERQQFIAKIQRANVRMQHLVERLLNLARLENRDSIEHWQPLSLSELVNNATQDKSPLAESKNIHYNQDALNALTIYGDCFLLEQALHNILDNAVDFADHNSIITLTSLEHAHTIELTVRNCGALIPEYALNKLTQRFFSLPRPDGRPRSSGLGLSFVEQIMALHHGQLRIINTDDGVKTSLIFPKNIR